jgi:tRNA nucleotidyltransferase (CCA-adding enzyme)
MKDVMLELKIYLVGGAVRDKLLKKPIREKDWVVVGASPKAMLDLGYKPVGKDFPVFLHPVTHEEYALARSEKKVAPGYQGFVFHTSADVTLEQDLMRRDLTINAIAQDDDGGFIDPYHGQDDIRNKLLKHVSDAFVEDPVRLLRLARFCAYLPDFSIHASTMALLKIMVSHGEVNALVPERVWAECAKACSYPDVEPFFKTLNDCAALAKIFPGLKCDYLDFEAFRRTALYTSDTISRWGALWHRADSVLAERIMQHLKIPKAYRDHVTLVQSNREFFQNFSNANPSDILTVLLKSDANRRPERLLGALKTLSFCLADYPEPDLTPIMKQMKQIDIQALLNQGLTGVALADAITQERLALIKAFCSKA